MRDGADLSLYLIGAEILVVIIISTDGLPVPVFFQVKPEIQKLRTWVR